MEEIESDQVTTKHNQETIKHAQFIHGLHNRIHNESKLVKGGFFQPGEVKHNTNRCPIGAITKNFHSSNSTYQNHTRFVLMGRGP